MATTNNTPGGNLYPPVGFHFRATFPDFPGDNEMRFQSISGLSAEIMMETYKEGGNNMYEYQLPVRVKFSDVSLKRGLLKGSTIFQWCLSAINDFKFSPKDLNIDLLDEQGAALVSWSLKGVLPKKWSVSEFNAEQSTIAIEQMDLVIREFRIQPK